MVNNLINNVTSNTVEPSLYDHTYNENTRLNKDNFKRPKQSNSIDFYLNNETNLFNKTFLTVQ